MATIRADLEGIVCAFRPNGDVVQLSAGDKVPADINVGSHLLDSGKSEPKAEQETALEPEEAPKRRGRPAKTSAVTNGTSG